jgi:hypothetical protein
MPGDDLLEHLRRRLALEQALAVSISKSTVPSEKRSLRLSARSSTTISGAM